jgi:protein-tyrosine phosphatase
VADIATSRWIELAGADNVRDLGGLPTADGRTVRPGRLIRSDSLQDLTDGDIRLLVDELGVRAVADLRTGVRVEHLSLFPEPDEVQVSDSADGPVVLPWQERDTKLTEDERQRGVSGVYLRYLDDRADSVIAALRLIAGTDGATIVHCAAGKDRTGVVVALALSEVGVTREAIIDDYALSADRVEAIIARLVSRRTYATDLDKDEPIDKHKPKPATMDRLLAALDERFGGAPGWLRSHGWTEDDAAALRHKLLD